MDAVNFMSTCLLVGSARNAQRAYPNRGARVIGVCLGAKGLGVQCELPHNSAKQSLGEMCFQVREERDVEGVAELLGHLIVLRLETGRPQDK